MEIPNYPSINISRHLAPLLAPWGKTKNPEFKILPPRCWHTIGKTGHKYMKQPDITYNAKYPLFWINIVQTEHTESRKRCHGGPVKLGRVTYKQLPKECAFLAQSSRTQFIKQLYYDSTQLKVCKIKHSMNPCWKMNAGHGIWCKRHGFRGRIRINLIRASMYWVFTMFQALCLVLHNLI